MVAQTSCRQCAGPFHEGGWGCAHHRADESCYSKMLNNGIGNRLQQLKTVTGVTRVAGLKRAAFHVANPHVSPHRSNVLSRPACLRNCTIHSK